MLVKGGGHAMAAGVTVRRENLDAFKAYLEQAMADQVSQARKNGGLLVDGLLTASGCTPSLVEEIEKAGPFGAGNPEPVFVLPEHKIVDVMPFGADHLRVRVQSGDGAQAGTGGFPRRLRAAGRRSGQGARGRGRISPARCRWTIGAARRGSARGCSILLFAASGVSG